MSAHATPPRMRAWVHQCGASLGAARLPETKFLDWSLHPAPPSLTEPTFGAGATAGVRDIRVVLVVPAEVFRVTASFPKKPRHELLELFMVVLGKEL
jgi:hypothetical protein